MARAARVLILEPDPEIRDLLARIVIRFGCEPTLFEEAESGEPPECDAVLVEPASVRRLAVATWLRDRRPNVPIICVSVDPHAEGAKRLRPAVSIEKPFGIADVERALRQVLGGASPGSTGSGGSVVAATHEGPAMLLTRHTS
jgi:DNA-binding NtrC family response regulator